ncbi:carboxymethylenebutenolidase [Sphaerotilus hippei]|uniref:Carboxymethylenebutenolidase n=1 Tax=Sphaerotilus hippei TaxID=744406 RepID=A0A318GXI4_9BURK|nr:dienelactone hydrolase family protein [Sphaerotilus hippei]PXW94555.1 carboxymethylenebutenolidase [Sphaerotilus hippei]
MDDAVDQSDFDSLVPGRGELSRRAFVRTSVGCGFAAAVLPVAAQSVISTPADGLVAGPVSIDVAGVRMPAYRAAPAGRTGLPVVLVVSEIFGVHEHIADVTRRLARQGYLAIAPELLVRQGDAARYTDIARLMSEVIAKVPDAQVMSDLDATVAWAATQGGDVKRLAVTGFCWGGRITWLYAAHQPMVRAGVAWYGRLIGNGTELTPRHPVDLAGSLKAPVLGLYGGQDGGIPLATIEQMKTALAAGSDPARRSIFMVYPDAPHAFHADYRPSYRKEAAEDGWRRCLEWFQAQGVA